MLCCAPSSSAQSAHIGAQQSGSAIDAKNRMKTAILKFALSSDTSPSTLHLDVPGTGHVLVYHFRIALVGVTGDSPAIT